MSDRGRFTRRPLPCERARARRPVLSSPSLSGRALLNATFRSSYGVPPFPTGGIPYENLCRRRGRQPRRLFLCWRRRERLGISAQRIDTTQCLFSPFGEKAQLDQLLGRDSDSVNLGSNPGPPAKQLYFVPWPNY